MRFATLRALPNLREVGGLAADDGSMVKYGQLFRSEAVNEPEPSDAEAIQRAGIRLVVDLRGESERGRAPNSWWHRQEINVIELDILSDIRGTTDVWGGLRENPTAAGGQAVMRTVYEELPDAAAAHLGVIVRRIIAGDLPILIHCTAGKDRTGFLIAALLHTIGIAPEVVMNDYMISGERLNKAVTEATRKLVFHHTGMELKEQAMATITGVHPSYLETSFATIDRKYGSFARYLEKAVGIDSAAIAKLKGRLLASAT